MQFGVPLVQYGGPPVQFVYQQGKFWSTYLLVQTFAGQPIGATEVQMLSA